MPISAHKYFCPGRINLIGEHIDYNGGLVMPAAISLGITATISDNGTDTIRISSSDTSDGAQVSIHKIAANTGHWSDHVIGVLIALQSEGIVLRGCDVHFSSTLPQGSGLSSSAAIEVLTYYMFTHFITGKEPERKAMALACQRVENTYIGVNCGIMDQYAVALGKQHHALLLDCAKMEHEEIPILLDDCALVIIDSKAPRQLAASAYNDRRAECDAALSIIRQKRNIAHLVDATMDEVNALSDAILKRRAWHVVTEQQRVKDAAAALKRNDLASFGALLNASHASLRDDYEVSSPQLDHIVHHAQEHDGCMGARLTGAGFGGCCIALLRKSSVADLQESLTDTYRQRLGLTLGFRTTDICDGVNALTL